MHHQMCNLAIIQNQYAPPNVESRPYSNSTSTKLHSYSKSICTTKCVITPLFKINMHHQMWNRAPTPTPHAPPATNLSKSKVKLHPYSKSICTTKFVISPLFKINMHHQMWNRSPTPTPYPLPARN